MHRHPLLTVDDLADLLQRGPSEMPLLLDVRWALGASNGFDEYLQGHIPGAVFVDLERDLSGRVSRDGRGGRHPMPRIDDFEITMAACGVDNARPIVCYDDWGSIPAARCWWLLRHFGKYDVHVLDGGFQKWKDARLRVESGLRTVSEGDFEVRRGSTVLLDADAAARYAREGILIDARPADRFRGENEWVDPIAGHIPGAVSLPARSLLNPDGTFLAPAELRRRFADIGVDGSAPTATCCGSGVQASHTALALAIAGLGDNTPVYIGSWSDWVSDPSRPVEVGEGRSALAS